MGNNKPYREEISYYPSGKIKNKYTYVDDKLCGEEVWYLEDGQVIIKKHWTGGKLDGEAIRYYPNGQVELKYNYVNDKRCGKDLWYHRNGQIGMIRNWVDDKLEGEEIHYDENGGVILIRNWVDDKLIWTSNPNENDKNITELKINDINKSNKHSWYHNGKVVELRYKK